MGGSDEGDGKGTKVYGVLGSSDGKGWVGGLFVADVKELGGRVLIGEVTEDDIIMPDVADVEELGGRVLIGEVTEDDIIMPEGDELVGGRVDG